MSALKPSELSLNAGFYMKLRPNELAALAAIARFNGEKLYPSLLSRLSALVGDKGAIANIDSVGEWLYGDYWGVVK